MENSAESLTVATLAAAAATVATLINISLAARIDAAHVFV